MPPRSPNTPMDPEVLSPRADYRNLGHGDDAVQMLQDSLSCRLQVQSPGRSSRAPPRPAEGQRGRRSAARLERENPDDAAFRRASWNRPACSREMRKPLPSSPSCREEQSPGSGSRSRPPAGRHGQRRGRNQDARGLQHSLAATAKRLERLYLITHFYSAASAKMTTWSPPSSRVLTLMPDHSRPTTTSASADEGIRIEQAEPMLIRKVPSTTSPTTCLSRFRRLALLEGSPRPQPGWKKLSPCPADANWKSCSNLRRCALPSRPKSGSDGMVGAGRAQLTGRVEPLSKDELQAQDLPRPSSSPNAPA